jgi:hypothetical protein
MTVQRRRCTDCGRTIYEQGPGRIIEAARTMAGDEPAEELLVQLESSTKPRDISRFADIALVLEDYAREGTLEIPRELNQLREDLWEIKPGDVRLTFYEPSDDVHPVQVTRLATGFIKKQQQAPLREINRGLWVIRQDELWVAREDEQT